MARTKNSKRWSVKDITAIENFIKNAKDLRSGLKEAAKHFGTSLNAVSCRWRRYTANEQVMRLKKNTTKLPIKKRKYTRKKSVYTKKRKYTKKVNVQYGRKPVQPAKRSMTFKIKKVNVDLNRGEITVDY
jgi:hypothetical protein